jgi:hypothetical protein
MSAGSELAARAGGEGVRANTRASPLARPLAVGRTEDHTADPPSEKAATERKTQFLQPVEPVRRCERGVRARTRVSDTQQRPTARAGVQTRPP